MEQTFQILEYNKILVMLSERANADKTKDRCLNLRPYLSESELNSNLRDTTQARKLLETCGTPPLPLMHGIEELADKAERGEMLSPDDLEEIGDFLVAVRRMMDYLNRGMELNIGVSYYAQNLFPLDELKEEIRRCIRGGMIDDYASAMLHKLRKEIEILDEKIKIKAESLLRANKKSMAENFVVNRNGRLCLPVKKEDKGKIKGTVIDASKTGSTLFIEPSEISKLQEEAEVLRMEADSEERRILYTLADLVAEEKNNILENARVIEKLDFMFAKAKLSLDLNAVEPTISEKNYVNLKQARHPLLDPLNCVPLDFELGRNKTGMIITGPNTGGKTVSIKTVGLFCLMAQSGLHVPCANAVIGMHNEVLCDIGDGQNMKDNLSTFSAHIKNVISILQRATKESLVILDELGSGTDPAEGMGIAVSVIEKLKESGCMFLVTTHYPEVKTYAASQKEIICARMAFDRENLRPLYQLEMGKMGDSCALYIAKRLGLPEEMLLFAAETAYGAVKEELYEELKIDPAAPSRLKKTNAPRIEKRKILKEELQIEEKFERGDSVIVSPEQKIAIVVESADQEGNVLVQIKKEKRKINHKRLTLNVKADQLYPADYDFSIVFDSVEHRKARHQMERKYMEGFEIREE